MKYGLAGQIAILLNTSIVDATDIEEGENRRSNPFTNFNNVHNHLISKISQAEKYIRDNRECIKTVLIRPKRIFDIDEAFKTKLENDLIKNISQLHGTFMTLELSEISSNVNNWLKELLNMGFFNPNLLTPVNRVRAMSDGNLDIKECVLCIHLLSHYSDELVSHLCNLIFEQFQLLGASGTTLDSIKASLETIIKSLGDASNISDSLQRKQIQSCVQRGFSFLFHFFNPVEKVYEIPDKSKLETMQSGLECQYFCIFRPALIELLSNYHPFLFVGPNRSEDITSNENNKMMHFNHLIYIIDTISGLLHNVPNMILNPEQGYQRANKLEILEYSQINDLFSNELCSTSNETPSIEAARSDLIKKIKNLYISSSNSSRKCTVKKCEEINMFASQLLSFTYDFREEPSNMNSGD